MLRRNADEAHGSCSAGSYPAESCSAKRRQALSTHLLVIFLTEMKMVVATSRVKMAVATKRAKTASPRKELENMAVATVFVLDHLASRFGQRRGWHHPQALPGWEGLLRVFANANWAYGPGRGQRWQHDLDRLLLLLGLARRSANGFFSRVLVLF